MTGGSLRTGIRRLTMLACVMVALLCLALAWSVQRGGAADAIVMTVIPAGGLLAVLLLAVVGRHTVARLDRPLGILLQGIAAIGEGNLDHRVELPPDDAEFGRVAEAFNRMAARLVVADEELGTEIQQRAVAQSRLVRSLAELECSNRELDAFAYVASHDLRAPLRGIRNLADWIGEDVKDLAGAETMRNLALLHNRVERLDMLLDSLLQYSRIGRLGGKTEAVDSARLVAEIVDYLAPREGFDVTFAGAMPALMTHRAPLEQVLRNLIANAIKHHDGASGQVVVSGRDLGEMVEFRVEDDGPGIAPAYHERIFMMFQTLKPRDQLEASGMGLAIVKKAVEGHGGRITVDSEPPRRGATFVFTWAKEPPEDVTQPAPATAGVEGG